ncbi:MAG TPA: hypothetical protein DDW91_06840 [Shewanella frigidimarina]|nr:hypothetical protein [Shewanella frigidimarina]
MSEDNSAEIRHINKNLETMSAAVSNLANSVNELVVQERVRAERDVNIENRVSNVEDEIKGSKNAIEWADRARKFWDSAILKWGIPIFCLGCLVAGAKIIGVPVFGD